MTEEGVEGRWVLSGSTPSSVIKAIKWLWTDGIKARPAGEEASVLFKSTLGHVKS